MQRKHTTRITDRDELMWLAGLLEGEACFDRRSGPNGRSYPRIRVNMKDRDIVDRVGRIFDTRVAIINTPSMKAAGIRPQFYTGMEGARAVVLMRLLHPHLGERRRAKIDELIGATNDGMAEVGAE